MGWFQKFKKEIEYDEIKEDARYQAAEEYANQFDEQNRIQCEYCLNWNLPNDINKCPVCGNTEFKIKEFKEEI